MAELIIAQYVIGPNRKKLFGVPIRLWITLLGYWTFSTCYGYCIQNIQNFVYLVSGPVFFVISVWIIYPSMEVFLNHSYLRELESIFAKTTTTSKFHFNTTKSNIYVLLLGIIVSIASLYIWICIIHEKSAILLSLVVFSGVIFLLPILSAFHYIFSLWKFSYISLSRISKEKIREMLLKELKNENPWKHFLDFKNKLEGIFSPFIGLLLRLSFLSFLTLVGIYIVVKIGPYGVPSQEIRITFYSNLLIFLIIITTLFILLYSLLKLSLYVRDILLAQLKELKLEMILIQDKYKEAVLNEVETMLLDGKFLFLPSHYILEILALLLSILSTTILIIGLLY